MSAFEYAWAVLKALPEQQAFIEEHYPASQLGQESFTSQVRQGTVHPAIIGAMRRLQETRNISQGEPFVTAPSLDMRVHPDMTKYSWTKRGMRPSKEIHPSDLPNIFAAKNAFSNYGQLTHVPPNSAVDEDERRRNIMQRINMGTEGARFGSLFEDEHLPNEFLRNRD